MSHDLDGQTTDASLWLDYSPEKSTFKLWSPEADEVVVHLYEKGHGGDKLKTIPLEKNNIWETTIHENLHGVYYTYQVKINNNWLSETAGVYAQAVGVNGQRAMVCDFTQTDPENWNNDKGPVLNNPVDAVLYELHIRDLSIHNDIPFQFPGKYLGLTESGFTTAAGQSVGVDHLKDLGITHVHLLPVFDHYSIDETRLEEPQFNWGYDPQNYNVPEGSYATNPYDGATRIREFKYMVQQLHEAGIGVILDVVYNHTGRTHDAPFELEYPGYYYRFNEDGSFSNASGCGNETASEKPMMRKFMIESCLHWMREYHIDGFRFDLMGIHDQESMQSLADALQKEREDVFIYGEGWTAGGSPLPEEKRSLKKDTYKINPVAAFSDDIRDGLKGSVFNEHDTGFVSGKPGMAHTMAFGIVGSTQHPEINYDLVNYSDSPWAIEPGQAISYASCHDNHTLWDRLLISRPDASESEKIEMHKLALGIVLTSQAVPFLHAGTEMLRTKGGEHNSYKSPDSVNQIIWDRKDQYKEVVDFVQGVIRMRKAHPAFRLGSTEKIVQALRFIDLEDQLVSYEIDGTIVDDSWSSIRVYYNASDRQQFRPITGRWQLAVENNNVLSGDRSWVGDMIELAPRSMSVVFQE